MKDALQPPAAPRVTWFPIILVHGTWGRGFFLKSQDEGSSENAQSKEARRWARRWFEKGSEFREKLEEQLKSMSLEYSVYPFHWSGELCAVTPRQPHSSRLGAGRGRAIPLGDIE
jgi:hypothetical protein